MANTDYPRMLFHQIKQPVIVHSREEEDALGQEWSRIYPHPGLLEPEPVRHRDPEPEPEKESSPPPPPHRPARVPIRPPDHHTAKPVKPPVKRKRS